MVFEADFNLIHLLILALGVYRITRIFIEDVVFSPIRDRIWAKFPPESTKIGYLLTCYWCLGLWVSALVVGCYVILPTITIIVLAIFAISAVVGMIDQKLNN